MRQEEADEITGALDHSSIFSTLPVIADNPRVQAEIHTSLERKNHAELVARAGYTINTLENDDTGARGKENRTHPFNHDSEPVRKSPRYHPAGRKGRAGHLKGSRSRSSLSRKSIVKFSN